MVGRQTCLPSTSDWVLLLLNHQNYSQTHPPLLTLTKAFQEDQWLSKLRQFSVNLAIATNHSSWHCRCEYCAKPSKYVDKNDSNGVTQAWILCDNHVFVKGVFSKSYFIETDVGIIQVACTEREINAACDKCRITQYKCHYKVLGMSWDHHMKMCRWHYRGFKYCCPRHENPLTKAWKKNWHACKHTGAMCYLSKSTKETWTDSSIYVLSVSKCITHN